VRRTLLSGTVALLGAAAVTTSGWALQAAALPPPARADRVAADASVWLHDYRLVVDVFHFHHRRFNGACLRGWYPGPGGVRTRASLLGFKSGLVLEVSKRHVGRLAGRPEPWLPAQLLALVGCSGRLGQILAGAAQNSRKLRAERSYAANQPAVELKLKRNSDKRFELFVSPSTHRPLVCIVELNDLTATARLYPNRVTARLLKRFHLPREVVLRPPR
jgi:hypothetical protein